MLTNSRKLLLQSLILSPKVTVGLVLLGLELHLHRVVYDLFFHAWLLVCQLTFVRNVRIVCGGLCPFSMRCPRDA